MTTIKRNSLPMILAGMLTLAAALPAGAAPGDDFAEQSMQQSASMPIRPDQTTAGFEYLFVAGSTFHPLQRNTTYSYPGGGCISKTGGADPLFAHKAVLPQGAVVRYLRLYYYDTSSSSVSAFFTTYDGTGNFNDHTSVSSVNETGGFGEILSPLMNYEVDRYAEPINIVADLGNQNDITLQFCGVRIAYSAAAIDQIFANGFELIPL